MKLDPSDQKIVNDFFREHVNRSFKNPMNSVRMNVDHTFEHRERIFQICNHLIDNKIPFWTEVRLNNGCIPDIVTPTHVTTFIEVFGTETLDDFKSNKLEKYRAAGFELSDFKFVDCDSELLLQELW
tara:strand:- start:550 stop:930 length:381 start_codon:yes stop_codon:yes gene_type:complete